MLEVKINNICLRIDGSYKDLLYGFSFTITPNSVYTIIGKNGSGKSTLIKSLTGLLDSRFYSVDGKSLWKGKDLLKNNPDELIRIRSEEIRYIFQDSINSLDPLKRIKYYFNNNDKKEILEIFLKQFQLPDYNSIYEKHPYQLSGGMLQRINYIIALMADPELIILDEPTSAIDAMNTQIFIGALKSYVKEKSNSVLIVTQDLLLAEKVSDKISFLKDGKLTDFCDTHMFFSDEDASFSSLLEAYKELSR